MREIKFRAKAINDGYYKGEWVYGYYTKILQGGKLVDVMTDGAHEVPIQIDTLGQYTGLKDKNGKEIWEGDIVRYKGERYLVTFNEVMFYASIHEFNPNVFGGYPLWMLTEDEENGCEVVGNIHDNPNWVKTEKNTKKAMGTIEYGKCEVCGKEAELVRTQFYYPIICECCDNSYGMHCVIVRHCVDCRASEPAEINPTVIDADGETYTAKMRYILSPKLICKP